MFQHAHRHGHAVKPLRLRRLGASPATVVLAAAPSVPITFQIQYKTDFGQVLKVVGAGEAFGEWNPKDAAGKLNHHHFYFKRRHDFLLFSEPMFLSLCPPPKDNLWVVLIPIAN